MKASEWPQSIDARLGAFFAQPAATFGTLLIVVLAAHGFEIFNLHLTIDEEIHIGAKSMAAEWAAQGRWGMALTSLALPSSVVPVVSTALGVGLLCASLWILTVRVFDADRYAALVATGIALTLPTLPFTLSFATLAYGIGFASLAAVGFILLLRRPGPLTLAASIIVGAFAIAVYQPMVFALAALVVFEVCLRGFASSHKDRLRALFALLGAVAAYFIADQIVRRLLRTEMQYVEQFVDVGGLLADPIGRIGKAARNVYTLSRIKTETFSLHTHWLAVFLLIAMLISLKPSNGSRGLARFAPGLTALMLAALPIAAEALTAHGVPLRSGVYFPFIVSLIAIVAFANTAAFGRLALTAFAVLAIIGNSVVDNRLYAAAAFAYERDRALAHDLLREIEKLAGGTGPTPRVIEVVGIKAWPSSPLIPKRETLGASFFEWDGGNRYRVAAYLSLFGSEFRGASNEQILPLLRTAAEMPAWPRDGSVRLEGDILLIKLSPYTPQQRQLLCAAGASELCP